MSQTMTPPGPPAGMPPGGAPAGPPQGAPVGVPPGAQPNPAFQQWMQAYQQQQGVVQENARRTAAFNASCELIRKDGVRGFKLDIEADSTVSADEMAEQQSRVQFLQQIIPFMEATSPLAQGNPKMAKLIGEVGMFAIRGFKVARTLEDAFEEAYQVLGEMPPPPPKGGHGPSVDPQLEQAKLAAQVQDTQTTAQTQQAVAASKAQTDELAIAQKSQQAQMQFAAEQQRSEAQVQNDQTEAAIAMAKIASAEKVAGARAAQMMSRSTKGLV